jgi:CubicO group peptidase (beta-lactamase class C family)
MGQLTTAKSAVHLMQTAVTENVFPGGVLLVSKADRIVLCEAFGYANPIVGKQMTTATVFDLASLTKPLATTLAVMRLVNQAKLKLSQSIETILPQFKSSARGRISIAQLLCHNSGLPAYRPYYEKLRDLPLIDRCKKLRRMLCETPLENPVGCVVQYSDIGFMLLRWIVERISDLPLDRFVSQDIYREMEIENLFFIRHNAEIPARNYAVTECCPWRQTLLEGQVHDDNAYAVGGVEGHAGLFGTAGEIHHLLQLLMAAYHGFRGPQVVSNELVKYFLQPQGKTNRTLGFDMPRPVSSSCGVLFSPLSVGHLGFTGTSFWMDLKRRIIIILLTNRVHPTRENNKIRTFRPSLHDCVMAELI